MVARICSRFCCCPCWADSNADSSPSESKAEHSLKSSQQRNTLTAIELSLNESSITSPKDSPQAESFRLPESSELPPNPAASPLVQKNPMEAWDPELQNPNNPWSLQNFVLSPSKKPADSQIPKELNAFF